MSYLVLARKYRPQNFTDVVGQEVIVDTLAKALTGGRIAHAFLLTGSRGVGKTTVARLLAKALSCEKGVTAEPCGTCVHCKEITLGSSMDVVEIDGASNTSVDNVRELRETIRYLPGSARFKIFIIDEVHMLSNSAFNALLKTLEEPPPHVKFIFATTEAHKIPITILSRCQRYDFRRIRVDTIVSRLESILASEKISIDPAGLLLIAQAAEGGMRDALSLTDQVLSFSPTYASLEDVTRILGLIDRQSIVRTVDALVSGDAQTALNAIDQACTIGHDLKQLMDAVATEFRHLSIAASTGSIKGLADLSPDDLISVDTRAKQTDAQDLQRLFAMALEAIDQVARSEQPKLMVELNFLRMLDRPKIAEVTTIMQAIERLEALSSAPSLRGAIGDVTIQKSSKIAPVEDKWTQFVKAITEQSAALGHHLEHGRATLSQNTLKIEFNQTLHYQRVVAAKLDASFLAAFKQFYGNNTVVEPYLSGTLTTPRETVHEANESATQRAQATLEEETRNHPVVKKALALFGGEIRAVKKTETPLMRPTFSSED